MIKFNGALLRPDVTRPFPKPIPLIASKDTSCTVKFIDDAFQARSVRLKSSLSKVDTDNRPRPLEYFEHTGHILNPETNLLQEDLGNLKAFTDKNLMVINEKKALIMKFVISNDYVISNDSKFSAHVEYMLQRAYKMYGF